MTERLRVLEERRDRAAGKPIIWDGFCGAGGVAKGLQRAGFYVVGVDINPQPRYCGDEFHQADAMTYPLGGFDAYWASPPCQGYSIMHNLPWLRGREYPLLILPTLERLEATGRPYAIENVMGARYGAKGLTKRGLEAHGLKAGYLCGQMFGLPFYRHRLFATNFLWLAPGHPKHTLNLHPRSERYVYGGTVKGLPGGSAGLDTKPRHENPVNSDWRQYHDGGKSYGDSEDKRGLPSWPGRRGEQAGLAVRDNRKGLANWQEDAPAGGVGVGHAKGWRLAAEAMGIDWMKQKELTQAIPPAYAEYIGTQLLRALGGA